MLSPCAGSSAFRAPDQISSEVVKGEEFQKQITSAIPTPVRIPPRAPFFKITLAQNLLCSTGVYVRRWVMETRWFSVRLHHWMHSDDSRAMHDHTWWFITFVIKGSYVDVIPPVTEWMGVGHRIAWRPALHRHTVQVSPGGCWTLLLTGPKIRPFGFWVNGEKFLRSNRYFRKFGAHVCD